MQRVQTKAIVLKRVEFGEADRIVTFLTPEQGQVTAMAKGVRKPKSKLAGGIEIFSLVDVTLTRGKGGVHTLISSRLDEYFDRIITDYERVEFGYEMIQRVYRATVDVFEEGVFEILLESMHALNDLAVPLALIKVRFYVFMLDIHGQLPNLQTDADGAKLEQTARYFLDISSGDLIKAESGDFGATHIKLLRLLVDNDAKKVSAVGGAQTVADELVKNVADLFEFVF